MNDLSYALLPFTPDSGRGSPLIGPGPQRLGDAGLVDLLPGALHFL